MKVVLAILATILVMVVAPTSASASTVSSSCYGVHGRSVCYGHSISRPTRYVCVRVTRPLLEEMSFQEIAAGGIATGVGLFATGTVFGLPLGAVLGLIGLSATTGGATLLWYADSPYFHPGRYCGYV
jgi:galactitol-specific phosphotransferase system IIC component